MHGRSHFLPVRADARVLYSLSFSRGGELRGISDGAACGSTGKDFYSTVLCDAAYGNVSHHLFDKEAVKVGSSPKILIKIK